MMISIGMTGSAQAPLSFNHDAPAEGAAPDTAHEATTALTKLTSTDRPGGMHADLKVHIAQVFTPPSYLSTGDGPEGTGKGLAGSLHSAASSAGSGAHAA